MHYVYLLQYHNQNKHYIGCTANLQKRVKEHRNGKGCKTTAQVNDPSQWRLMYYEAYAKKSDAMRREAKLKQYGSARGHLKRRIKDSINHS